MPLDNYDPSRSLSAYFPDRDERRLARLWAREKVLHDFADLGAVEFFEGDGTNPTQLDEYATNKLWLRVEPGVTDEPGEIRYFKGGDPTLLASWPILDREGFASHLGARAGAEFDYVWSAETSGDPGTGKVRGNHATLASVTELALSKTGRQGQDYTARLLAWQTGDTVRIYGVGTESDYVDVGLSGDPSDQGDCVTVAVTVSTASALTDGQLAGVAHYPTALSLADDWATAAAQSAADAATSEANALSYMNGAGVITTALPRVDRTALKALDTDEITVAYLTEAGREGMLQWRTGDYSSEVSADAQEGIYIKADEVAATSGAWIRTRQSEITIADFGEVGGANAAPAIQAMVDLLGYFRLPLGTFNVQDPITIPTQENTYGALFYGAGKEQSVINASDMSGTSVLRTAGSLKRVTMRDFAIHGDADTAFDFATNNPGLYQSHFQDINAKSVAGPAVKATSLFSTMWQRCDFWSEEDYSIDIAGGNTVTLINCYAHDCGDDKAGFKIDGNATLISCNGVDKIGDAHAWGHFGVGPAFFRIRLINCNLEDFGEAAIWLEGGGWLTLEGCTLVAPASGTFECYIKDLSDTNANNIWIDHATTTISKGATMSGASKIILYGAQLIMPVRGYLDSSDNFGGYFPNYYNRQISIVITLSNLHQVAAEFGHFGIATQRLAAQRDRSFELPSIGTITANASTFDMGTTPRNCLQTANSSATSLTNITGIVADGHELKLLIKDANTTVRHDVGGAGRFILTSGADYGASNGDVLTFVANSSVWRQVGGPS